MFWAFYHWPRFPSPHTTVQTETWCLAATCLLLQIKDHSLWDTHVTVIILNWNIFLLGGKFKPSPSFQLLTLSDFFQIRFLRSEKKNATGCEVSAYSKLCFLVKDVCLGNDPLRRLKISLTFSVKSQSSEFSLTSIIQRCSLNMIWVSWEEDKKHLKLGWTSPHDLSWDWWDHLPFPHQGMHLRSWVVADFPPLSSAMTMPYSPLIFSILHRDLAEAWLMPVLSYGGGILSFSRISWSILYPQHFQEALSSKPLTR